MNKAAARKLLKSMDETGFTSPNMEKLRVWVQDATITARTTGTRVSVIPTKEVESDPDQADHWTTLCEDHGFLVNHETKKAAKSFQSHPEDWCEECRVLHHVGLKFQRGA